MPDDRTQFSNGDADPPPLPPDVLLRRGARMLDPIGAWQQPKQQLRPTAYVPDRLLGPRRLDQRARSLVEGAAARLGSDAETVGLAGLSVIRLTPQDGNLQVPDAWEILQTARVDAGDDARILDGVGLDHVMMATNSLIPLPYDSPHAPDPGPGAPMSEYGRFPVSWVGPAPDYGAVPPAQGSVQVRRPVVAVLDTGCGTHDWLAAPVVLRDPVDVNGVRIGLPDNQAEDRADVLGPLDGEMDRVVGHGTFICGLIRQLCPQATIISVRVIEPDGAMLESDLVTALEQLYGLARRHVETGTGDPVDVVSLSLGYYEETANAAFRTALWDVLRRLGQVGVVVSASVGNSATIRKVYPAALTPHDGGVNPKPEHDCVPLLSVGALNPDRSVAAFSNSSAGDGWVCTFRPGAALVSTFPTIDAGGNPTSSRPDPSDATGQRQRGGIDRDGYGWREQGQTGSGFAVWSGTSFATPIVAGEIALALMRTGIPAAAAPADPVLARNSAVDRGWAAVSQVVSRLQRP